MLSGPGATPTHPQARYPDRHPDRLVPDGPPRRLWDEPGRGWRRTKLSSMGWT